MSITAVHPLYAKFSPIWVKLNDVFAGQDTIKEKRQKYLGDMDTEAESCFSVRAPV